MYHRGMRLAAAARRGDAVARFDAESYERVARQWAAPFANRI